MSTKRLYHTGKFFEINEYGEIYLLERNSDSDRILDNGNEIIGWKRIFVTGYDDESSDAGLKLELEFHNHGVDDIMADKKAELRDPIIADEMIRCAVDYKHETELKNANYVSQYGDLDYSYTANDGTKFQISYDQKRLSHLLRFEVKVTFNEKTNKFQLSFRDYKWFVSQMVRLRAR